MAIFEAASQTHLMNCKSSAPNFPEQLRRSVVLQKRGKGPFVAPNVGLADHANLKRLGSRLHLRHAWQLSPQRDVDLIHFRETQYRVKQKLAGLDIDSSLLGSFARRTLLNRLTVFHQSRWDSPNASPPPSTPPAPPPSRPP